MKEAKITLIGVDQNIQELNSDGEGKFLSRILFAMRLDGKEYQGLSITVGHPPQTNFEKEDFEFGRIQGYDGPFNYVGFTEALTEYYRYLFGQNGTGMQFDGNYVGKNNLVMDTKCLTLYIDGEEKVGW